MLTKKEILEDAKKEAEKLVEDKKLTTNQLRKFFDEVKRLRMKYETLHHGREDKKQEAFEKISPMLAMLVANANYALARKRIPSALKDFLEKRIKKINSSEQFEDFVKYFEAVVGYYYYVAPDNLRND